RDGTRPWGCDELQREALALHRRLRALAARKAELRDAVGRRTAVAILQPPGEHFPAQLVVAETAARDRGLEDGTVGVVHAERVVIASGAEIGVVRHGTG